jgi:hypothetical protein
MKKSKISGKYPVIVGVFPVNISENGVIKAFKKNTKIAEKALLNSEYRFWVWYYHGTFNLMQSFVCTSIRKKSPSFGARLSPLLDYLLSLFGPAFWLHAHSNQHLDAVYHTGLCQ